MDYEQFIEMTALHAEVVGVIQTSRELWQYNYEVKAAECERLRKFYDLTKQANEDKTKEIKALKAENERFGDQLDDEKDLVDRKVHEMEAVKAQHRRVIADWEEDKTDEIRALTDKHSYEVQVLKDQHKQWVSEFVDESAEDYERILKLEDQVRSLEWDKKDLTVCLENVKKAAQDVLTERTTHEQKCGVLVSQYGSLGQENMALKCKLEEAESKVEIAIDQRERWKKGFWSMYEQVRGKGAKPDDESLPAQVELFAFEMGKFTCCFCEGEGSLAQRGRRLEREKVKLEGMNKELREEVEELPEELGSAELVKLHADGNRIVAAAKWATDATAELEEGKKAFEAADRLAKQEVCRLESENKKLDEALQVAKVELLPVKEDLRVSRRYAQHNLITMMKLRKELDAAQGLSDELQTELDRVNAGWQTDREKLFEYHAERATMNRLLFLAENKVKVGQAFEEMMRKDLKTQRKITAKLERQLCESVERREIEKQGMMSWGKELQSDCQNDMRVAKYVAEEEKSKAAKSAVTRELVLKAAHRWELKNALDNAQFWYEKCQQEIQRKEEAQLAAQGWVEVGEKDEDDEVVAVDDASRVTDDEANFDTDEECQMASHDEDKMIQACVDSEMELDEGEMVEAIEDDMPDEGEMVGATAAVEDEANEMADDEMTDDEGEMVEADEEWEAEEYDGELVETDEVDEYGS
ncbi:hypothetical protein LTR10_001177 [Elasticomyces elasticus]|nr:hypothetical protein LTR10_001177 [Elasticomyces elasticus]KAK4965457.1 hypothetical protein LTR42_012213 [Elasticomyces elasticus]